MLKTEIVYREIIESWEGKNKLSQLELSKRLGISLSTVNNAIRPLVSMGAIGVLPRSIKVIDKEKALLYWASVRDLQKDIVYSTRGGTPGDIEKNMPYEVIYTAYSGYKFLFRDVPADYGEVYVYLRDVEAIRKRFPPQKGPPNLFVLTPDRRLPGLSKDNIAPPSQIFVDLWNIREWYAKEFIKALKEKLLV